ncbi:MAG: polysaccharide deacetylase family protein, partial [Flavobacteriales bacterium]|nr:polysaccharide deacetylase family protein [Flavobacteriales bacterium]
MIVKPPKFVQRILKSFIWRHNEDNNNIWLTFDDGPDSKVTPFILQILKNHQIKATFFLVGEQINKYPE